MGRFWAKSHEGAPNDGSARKDGDARLKVIRGGSWKDPAETARCAYRAGVHLESRGDHIGFRCVKDKEGRP